MSSISATSPEETPSTPEPGQPETPETPDNPDQTPPDDGGGDSGGGSGDAPSDPPSDPPTDPPSDPPGDVPIDPPADPPVDPPVDPPSDPPVDPPAGPPGDPPGDDPGSPPAPSSAENRTSKSDNSIALSMPFLKLQASVTNELVLAESISVVVGSKTDMAVGAKFIYTAAPLEFKINVGFSIVSDRSRLLKRIHNHNEVIVGGLSIAREDDVLKELRNGVKTRGEEVKRVKARLETYARKEDVEAATTGITQKLTKLTNDCTTAVTALNQTATKSMEMAGECERTVGAANTLAESIESACAKAQCTAGTCNKCNAVGNVLAGQITSSPLLTTVN